MALIELPALSSMEFYVAVILAVVSIAAFSIAKKFRRIWYGRMDNLEERFDSQDGRIKIMAENLDFLGSDYEAKLNEIRFFLRVIIEKMAISVSNPSPKEEEKKEEAEQKTEEQQTEQPIAAEPTTA